VLQVLSWWHTPARQVSLVHALASSHERAVPLHTLSAQASPSVQASRSSHGAVFAACPQVPVLGSQVSVVHTFESLQSFGVPAWHTPLLHRSLVVQRS
jgi:hypothetical protein